MFIGRTDAFVPQPSPAISAPSRHLQFIDCARGYAVLMVIACHLTKDFPLMPWPARRLAMSGWFGVQLFFLASALTLMMSWHEEGRRRGRNDLRAFFIRRVFRIAPAYYLAGILYFLIDPPAGGFDTLQALRSALFINAWKPDWISVLHGGWRPVPGGWSIGVEFTFYALFPFFAFFVTSLRRAALVFAACVATGLVANRLALPLLAGLAPDERSNFLYFWFPNQACVFPLGAMLYFLLRDLGRFRALLQRFATPLAIAAIAGFCTLSTFSFGHYLGDGPGVPTFLAVCPTLFLFLLALSGRGFFTNNPASWVGRLSFSAYLLHFAFLPAIAAYPALMHTGAAGVPAIAAYLMGLAVLLAATLSTAWLSCRFVERPMVNLGRRLIHRLQYAPPYPAVRTALL